MERKNKVLSLLIRYWLYILIVIVVAIGTGCSMITGIQNYSETPTFLEALYHTLNLFFLGSHGFPGGDPLWASYLLLFIYFIAPIFTVGIIVDFIRSLVYNPIRQVKRMRGHIIIGGAGKLGGAVYDRLRKSYKAVVPIDFLEDNPLIHRVRSEYMPYVIGDIASRETLDRSNIQEAKMFLALSGNDIANIDGAILAKNATNGKCECLIHISNPHLLMNVTTLIENEKIRVINSYEIVGKKVVELLQRELLNQPSQSIVVIAGFGNFGKMVAKILYSLDVKVFQSMKIVVIDRKTTINKEWKTFCSMYELNEEGVEILEGDIRDPQIWDKLISEGGTTSLGVVIATDNDPSNVSTTFFIRRKLRGKVFVVTRLFKNVAAIEASTENVKGIVFSEVTLEAVMNEIKSMTDQNKHNSERIV